MKKLKLIPIILSLSFLALVLTACQPIEEQTTDVSAPTDEQTDNRETSEEIKEIDVAQEQNCVYQDGACCQDGGKGVCQIVNITCEAGKESNIIGCNEKCEAEFECVNKLTINDLINNKEKYQNMPVIIQGQYQKDSLSPIPMCMPIDNQQNELVIKDAYRVFSTTWQIIDKSIIEPLGIVVLSDGGVLQGTLPNYKQGQEIILNGIARLATVDDSCQKNVKYRSVYLEVKAKDIDIDLKPVPDTAPEESSPFCQNLCGDGNCAEVVCDVIGCPCAETVESCPEDCGENDKNVDWQTFTNDIFSLKYPITWQVEIKKSGVRNTVIFKDLKTGYPGNDYQVLSVSYMPNQGGLSLADWWAEESKNSIYKKTETVKIANIETFKIEATEAENGPRYVFITNQKAGWIFDLSTTSLNQKNIDQILSTFNFNL